MRRGTVGVEWVGEVKPGLVGVAVVVRMSGVGQGGVAMGKRSSHGVAPGHVAA